MISAPCGKTGSFRLLPKAVAVCKYDAHTENTDLVSLGNVKADAAAKRAAQHEGSPSACMTNQPLPPTADVLQRVSEGTVETLWLYF